VWRRSLGDHGARLTETRVPQSAFCTEWAWVFASASDSRTYTIWKRVPSRVPRKRHVVSLTLEPDMLGP
jgi:hypothetical protein